THLTAVARGVMNRGKPTCPRGQVERRVRPYWADRIATMPAPQPGTGSVHDRRVAGLERPARPPPLDLFHGPPVLPGELDPQHPGSIPRGSLNDRYAS